MLQEAGVDLSAIIREEGFYVSRRVMSSPLAARGSQSFGSAVPIELPTIPELERFASEFVSVNFIFADTFCDQYISMLQALHHAKHK